MKIKILILALLFPFFVDGQISAAKRLLLSQILTPTYDGNTLSTSFTTCEFLTVGVLISNIGFFTNYDGADYDSIQIISINKDYDADEYEGFSLTLSGSEITLPETIELNSSGYPISSIYLEYANRYFGDYILCTQSPQQCEIIFRIKDTNDWGPQKSFIRSYSYTP